MQAGSNPTSLMEAGTPPALGSQLPPFARQRQWGWHGAGAKGWLWGAGFKTESGFVPTCTVLMDTI